MPIKSIDGKKIANDIKAELKKEISALARKKITPNLTVVLVGKDNASQIYVQNKERTAQEVGIDSRVIKLAKNISQQKLESLIQELNGDKKVNGILIQLPLPKNLDTKKVISLVSPLKDVDCFHPENIGKLLINEAGFLPCTPAGILELLKQEKIKIESQKVVIVGRSNIVGKPLAMMLMNLGATVTVCHSKTKNLKNECLQADILISATGKAGLIKGDMLKQKAVVIDVGINRDETGKLVGDVDFKSALKKVSRITPVPGGVGPMTIVMLMKNTIQATKLQQ